MIHEEDVPRRTIHLPNAHEEQIVTLTSDGMICSHVSVIVDCGARVTIIDRSVCPLTNIDITVSKNARVVWLSDVLHEHINICCHAHADVVFIHKASPRCGSSGRSAVMCTLEGEGARAILRFVCSIGSGGTLDLSTVQRHEAPSTRSDCSVVGSVNDGGSLNHKSVMISEVSHTQLEASDKDAIILLGQDARATVKPWFDMKSPDARCTHAAAVGGLDERHVWYLHMHGIGTKRAHSTIIQACVRTAFDTILPTLSPRAVVFLEELLLSVSAGAK